MMQLSSFLLNPKNARILHHQNVYTRCVKKYGECLNERNTIKVKDILSLILLQNTPPCFEPSYPIILATF